MRSLVRRFARLVTDARERSALAAISQIPSYAANSGSLSADALGDMFRSPEITAKWGAANAALS